MKTAILTELSVARSMMLPTCGIYIVVGLAISLVMESIVSMAACIATMAPIMMMFTFAGYDYTNGWERFRATLPVSRNAMVVCRYVNVLVCSLAMLAVALCIAAAMAACAPVLPFGLDGAAHIADEAAQPIVVLGAGAAGMCLMLILVAVLQPFTLRFGLTTALRWVPALGMLALFFAGLILPDLIDMPDALESFFAWLDSPSNFGLATAGLALVTLVLYVLSCSCTVALYRAKEL